MRLLLSILLLSLSGISIAQLPESKLPELTGRIVDLTNTLSQHEINDLTTIAETLENERTVQYVIAIIPSTQPYSIEEYSISLATYWELGQKESDNGILLLIAKQDRQMRIEVGYGLEEIITDAKAKRIISQDITPYFKKNEFFRGILVGSNAITSSIIGIESTKEFEEIDTQDYEDFVKENFSEYSYDDNEIDRGTENNNGLLYFLFPFIIIGIAALQIKLGKLKGALIGLPIVIITIFILTYLTFTLIYGGFLIIVTLIISIPNKGGGGFGGGGGFYGGSYAGSSFGGGFSGGFSGGGGSFGGGGASGGW